MKIAVTGGMGFIGRYFIGEYSSDCDLTVMTSDPSAIDVFPNVRCFLCDYKEADYMTAFEGADAVIHLGGIVMHGMDYSMHVEDYVDNLKICEKVFEACRKLDIKNVIFASSVAVYDQKNDSPIRECGDCQPNSMYGVIKVAAEKQAEIYNRRYNMNIKILRFAQVVGLGKRLDLKQFWDLLVYNGANKLPISVYGEGFTGRDIIYVKDAARALMCAVRTPNARGIYNIGSGTLSTNRMIAETYCEVWDNMNNLFFDKRKEESGIQTYMDCSKAEKDLSFVAEYSLKEMAEDIKKLFLQNANYPLL